MQCTRSNVTELPSSNEVFAVVPCAHSHRWLRYGNPLALLEARETAEVLAVLAETERLVETEGLLAAGFVAYEAAGAFDAAFETTSAKPGLPLAWFALFRPEEGICAKPAAVRLLPQLPAMEWTASVPEGEFARNVDRIRRFLEHGDSYQVNYTYRLRAPFRGDPMGLFHTLAARQSPALAAYLHTGRWSILSVSPELFFERDGGRLCMRPMKGTRPRGHSPEEDRRMRADLAASPKDRAENIMIVDMVRNDLGRIAATGSVRATRLFDIEQYPTVFQMTATIEAETNASVPEIMSALFPCASVTGAPKVRTMQIIAQLEREPRGVYCGCIGLMRPGHKARFAVGIRTMLIDNENHTAEYGVGGGIVWDSHPREEWEETRVKARILKACDPPFQLLESLLWEPQGELFLLEEHMARLQHSAEILGFACRENEIIEALGRHAAQLPPEPHKLRLLLAQDGKMALDSTPLKALGQPSPYRLRLASEPVDSHNLFLYHKTTRREVYEHARHLAEDCDDVLLWNERGELTESAIANLVLEIDGAMLTPPVDSGLLAGTYRAALLRQGKIAEHVLRREDLARASRIWLVNSVRRWMEARLA